MDELYEDPLIKTITEQNLISKEKCAEILIGKSKTVRNVNICMGTIASLIDRDRWMNAITEKLTNLHFVLQNEAGMGQSATIPDLHYIPAPGKNNGERIFHKEESQRSRMRIGHMPTETEVLNSPLCKSPEKRSREAAWIIPYKTSRGTRKLLFMLTFDPHHLATLRTNPEELETSKKYWEHLAIAQGKILLKDNPPHLFLHGLTSLQEWMENLFPPEGKEKEEWQRHKISESEREKSAILGLDIYYSNAIVAYGWSTLEKPKGRERSRVNLQQLLSKRVILFDPIYGKSSGTICEIKNKQRQDIRLETTEKEITARAIWESTILQAYSIGASDIHLEPQIDEGRKEPNLIVSFRKDNEMTFHAKCPLGVGDNVVRYALEGSGVIRSDTDRGQDGRKTWIHPRKKAAIDLRISVTPMKQGTIQEVVIRLLDNTRLKDGLGQLGLETEELAIWRQALAIEESLILVSGPTGSGKCLAGNSLITTNIGTLPIKDIHNMFQMAQANKTPFPITALTESGSQPIKQTFHLGKHPVLNIRLSNGMILEPKKTHHFRVLTPNLELIWKTAGNLLPQDQLIHIGKIPKTPKTSKKNPPHQEILLGTQKEQIQFLCELTQKQGSISKSGIKIFLSHEKSVRNYQHMLAGMGIYTELKKHPTKTNCWEITIPRKTSLLKLKKLGFILKDNKKQILLQKKWEEDTQSPDDPKITWEISPETQKEICEEIQQTKGYSEKHAHLLNAIYNKDNKISSNTLAKGSHLFPNLLKKWPAIAYLINHQAQAICIQSIKKGKIKECYDLEMTKTPSYTVGGIMGHNSSSLFAAVCDIYHRDPKRKITSIEDPIEYSFPFRATQHEVNASYGMTFPAYIRRMMRNDIDTVLLGEIRDPETLFAALQLGLTGHQILSTIHAKSAADTILRMLEFKPEPYLVSEVVKLVVAQRLAATPCPVCTKILNPREAEEEIQKNGGIQRVLAFLDRWKKKHPQYGDGKWKKSEGCTTCRFTGVQGKTAIQEFLVINKNNKKHLKEGNVAALQQSMQERELYNLETTAWKLAWMGKIPIFEAGKLTDTLEDSGK